MAGTIPRMKLLAAGILIISGIILSSSAGLAATYYVDGSNGADTNPGTLAQPFRTIQKAASTLAAGDTCLVRRGVYRETVVPARSGSPGASITFRPYGTEQVTISGADVISGWTSHSGSICKAPMAWDRGPGANQVFVDGKFVFEARWPNSTDLSRPTCAPMDSGSAWTAATTGAIRDADLSQPSGTWTNALVYMRPGYKWYARTARVTSSSSGSINFTIHSTGHLSYEDIAKYGGDYFITGTMAALDKPGEWYSNGSTLYLWAPAGDNPASHLVEAKRRQYAFDISGRAHVVIQGINVFASAIKSDSGTYRCIIDGINANYVDHFFVINRGPYAQGNQDYTGIILAGDYNEIRNSKIAWSAGNGITLQGSHNKVTNCLIHDVVYAGTDAGAVNTAAAPTSNHEITYNTMYNSGRSLLVHIKGTALKITNNHIYNAGLQLTDLGATYTIASDGAGTEIACNVVHGCPFSGIYLDNNNRNYNVHHNVVYDVKYALHLNRPSVNNKVYHNTIGPLRASGQALAGFPDKTTAQYRSDMTGTVIRNNVFRASSWDVGTDPPPTMDHNIESSVDPRFVNSSTANYQLQSGSPAINAGVSTPYSGQITGSGPDCGAFEYGIPAWTAGHSDAGPRPPTISQIGDQQVAEGHLLVFTVTASEPDGDAVSLEAAGLPDGASFNPNTGLFSWTPTSSQLGSCSVAFTAADKDGTDAVTVAITVVGFVPPPADILAYWKFEGYTLDEVSTIDGTPQGTVAYTQGKIGQAFSGMQNGYVNLGSSPALDSLSELTIAAWVMPIPDSPPTQQPIINLYKNDVDRIYMKIEANSRIRVFNDIADTSTGHNSADIPTLMNTWFFVAWTYAADGTSQIYVNGKPSGPPMKYAVSLASLGRGFNAQIGYEPFIGSFFHGAIDEVKLFDRALSADEIARVYENPGTIQPVLNDVANAIIKEGGELAFTVSVKTGGPATFAAQNLPEGATLDSQTGAFSWTPSNTQSGKYEITFVASNSAASDSRTAVVTVHGSPLGDVNDDCVVNILDFVAIIDGITRASSGPDDWKLDLNNDGVINVLDLIVVRGSLNMTCP